MILEIYAFCGTYTLNCNNGVGCDVGGCSSPNTQWLDNNGDDRLVDRIPLRVLTEDLPFCMLLAPHAELLWIYFWDHLVGDSSQPDGLLRCITC